MKTNQKIKIFNDHCSNANRLEQKVNDWLNEQINITNIEIVVKFNKNNYILIIIKFQILE